LTSPIEFRQLIQTQLRGGILVDCTKHLGLENESVGNYLKEQLKMKPIVVIDCDDFPSNCRIAQGGPRFPVQICASLNSKVSALLSDFVIPETHEKQLARGLIGWCKKQSMALIITFTASNQSRNAERIGGSAGDVSAAYSTENAKHRIAQSRTDMIQNGILEGVPAALLTEGSWNNFDVIALQITPQIGTPKEIAEKTIQALDVVLPEVKFESEAARFDERLELDLSKGSSSLGE
jgi:predicted ATP-grasp superfamily ATP-dependent carboligase